MATKSYPSWRDAVAVIVSGVAGAAATQAWHRYGPHRRLTAAQRRLARAHQQRMHWELLSKALDDPDLAVVIDTYGVELSPQKRRQMMYANLWYISVFHQYESGLLTEQEILGPLRELFQSSYMREYWELTRPHRAALDTSSSEARIGRIAESLFQELDEADTDEWWVVGQPSP